MILKKKMTTILLTGALALVAIASGCGKKDVDYSMENNQDNNQENDQMNASDNTVAEGGLAGRLGIPESCEISLDVGNTELQSIVIKDDAIEIPKTDSMSVAYYEAINIDESYKQHLVETFFDQSQGVYAYDPEHRIRSEIEKEIEQLKAQKEAMAAEGNMDSWYDEYIAELEVELQGAPEEYPLIEDYSGDIFLGTKDGYQYGLIAEVLEDRALPFLNVNLILYDGISYRPYQGAQEVSCREGGLADDFSEINLCQMSQEEAVRVADDFLLECGATDMIQTTVSVLEWEYYDHTGEEIMTEYDGYVINYDRSVNNTPSYGCRFYNLDNLMQKMIWADINSESYSVYVDGTGVVEANWGAMFSPTGEIENNVTLLSWDEMISAANENIAKYYEEYPTQYKKIEFHDVRLSYYPVVDEEKENSYKYIPVWVFSQYEEYIDEDGSKTPNQLVIMNAMDGTVLDLVKLVKTFGVYMEY